MVCVGPLALAEDASYCVDCENPDRNDVCRVTGDEAQQSHALSPNAVTANANEGNHASSSAERSDAGCRGVDKVYSYDGPAIPEGLASDPRVQTFIEKVDRERREFDKPKGQAPQTLVELT